MGGRGCAQFQSTRAIDALRRDRGSPPRRGRTRRSTTGRTGRRRGEGSCRWSKARPPAPIEAPCACRGSGRRTPCIPWCLRSRDPGAPVEEPQRREDAADGLGAGDVPALDSDGIGREGEPDGGDARGRAAGMAIRHEAIARVRQLPEVPEGPRLDVVEEGRERPASGADARGDPPGRPTDSRAPRRTAAAKAAAVDLNRGAPRTDTRHRTGSAAWGPRGWACRSWGSRSGRVGMNPS